jgi:hypothetical protein
MASASGLKRSASELKGLRQRSAVALRDQVVSSKCPSAARKRDLAAVLVPRHRTGCSIRKLEESVVIATGLLERLLLIELSVLQLPHVFAIPQQ